MPLHNLGRRVAVLAVAVACLAVILWVGGDWLLHGARQLDPSASALRLRLDASALILALGLWLIGLAADALGRGPLALLLVSASAVLATGRLATQGSPDGAWVHHLLALWFAPLFFDFHLKLLAEPAGCLAQGTLRALYAAAGLLSLPLIVWPWEVFQTLEWYPDWHAAVGLLFHAGLVLAALLLIAYWLEGWPELRLRHMRLIAFGTVLGLAPAILLTTLPRLWGTPAWVPPEVTAAGLLVIPVFYLHALAPLGGRLDLLLRRASIGYATLTLGAFVFLTAIWILSEISPTPERDWPLMALLLLAGFFALRDPSRKGLAALTRRVWEGSDSRYTRVVAQLAESLSATLDPAAVQRSLVHKLARAMHLSWGALYMRGDTRALSLLRIHGTAPIRALVREFSGDGRLATYLGGRSRPIIHEHLCRALPASELDAAESRLLALGRVQVWVPLVAGGVLHGVLLLGPRPGSELFVEQDVEILATLAHQSGIAAHNARLMGEVRASRRELARAHQQLTTAGEQERRRMARELHDGAVQQLIGISYQIAEARRQVGSGAADHVPQDIAADLDVMREEVLDVVGQLRSLIRELRPAGLADLGFEAALAGYVAQLEREHQGAMPEIHLQIDDELPPMRGEVGLCLFRVAQEGLRNVLRHAAAEQVDLRLQASDGHVEMTLRDDGRGFSVPPHLSELASRNHFGLLSMAERVDQVEGALLIRSAPGAGTELTVRIALQEETLTHGQENTGAPGR